MYSPILYANVFKYMFKKKIVKELVVVIILVAA